MSNCLAIIDRNAIQTLSTPEYKGMLEKIQESAPEINRTTQIFQKTQSQFMDNMMTVSHMTPFRNLRQVLAEMKNARQAMAEAYFAVEKKKIEILIRERMLEGHFDRKQEQWVDVDPLQRKMLEIEIMELQWSIDAITENVGGAIRRLANYTNQYNHIKSQLPDLSEETFEAEEERYHIMKAFEQGLNAARSHGGWIDEGNQIYLTQVGINGTVGQMEVTKYLQSEHEILETPRFKNGVEIEGNLTIEYQLMWLNRMADKYAGSSKLVIAYKGMSDITDYALVGKEE
ncbi:MAG TPA: hypothetical protein VN372_03720 [Methanospirillum sp.]|nr:hypothetical protein [Methanospirillum sp.]